MNTQHRTIGVAVSSVAIGALLILVPALPTDAHSEPDPGTVYCEARGFKPECRIPGPERPSRPKDVAPVGQPDELEQLESRCGVPVRPEVQPSTGTSSSGPVNRHLEELENLDARDTLKPSTGSNSTTPLNHHLEQLENMLEHAPGGDTLKPSKSEAASAPDLDDFVVRPSPW